jgi:hypothetical protein
VSKILAFVTVLTLLLPQRPTPEQSPQPDSDEQAQLAFTAGPGENQATR